MRVRAAVAGSGATSAPREPLQAAASACPRDQGEQGHVHSRRRRHNRCVQKQGGLASESSGSASAVDPAAAATGVPRVAGMRVVAPAPWRERSQRGSECCQRGSHSGSGKELRP